ncbi:4Fe-4S dicluster domain-containing protein, partial [Streptomyces sp. NPDC053086]|uniref:4Fe-4S dicluster domain-containing protein n=1 Tax=Streptomyces sp. NPDC053086 TaxID=3365698 RepID=UPI0037D2E6AF
MQIAATVVSLVVSVAGVALLTRAAMYVYRFVGLGQPVPAGSRTNDPGRRSATLVREFLGHTRMTQWRLIGFAHWFVAIGFYTLLLSLVSAYGELFDAHFTLPVVGHWVVYEVYTEVLGLLLVLGCGTLLTIRLLSRPTKPGRKSRFAGSTAWQGYYVSCTIIAIGVCIVMLRALDGALDPSGYDVGHLVSHPISLALKGLGTGTLENLIYLFAGLKVTVSLAWACVIGLNPSMGVAWHRFLGFPNIWFKRNADGSTALGPLLPMTSGGKPIDFTDPGEDDVFGVSQVEQFSWKGLLDFSTCTECGRCQSQCPAWNTGKPLSPKLLIMSLRDHAHAKAPYLLAGGGKTMEGEEKASEEQLKDVPAAALAEAERPLIGTAEENGVIDPDVLWSCTTCGACVEQCPVDIEHIDHIVDMRRYQVMIESAFPS